MSDASALEVAALGGGRYLVGTASRRQLAYAVRDRGLTWVFVDGRTYAIGAPEAGGAPRGAARRDDEVALAAPMPATVVSVAVAPGQEVARGDVLVMLEAMKMELAIRAPRDGTVRAVACRAGELVQPGVPLVELD